MVETTPVTWQVVEIYTDKPFKSTNTDDIYVEALKNKTTKLKAVELFEFKVASNGTVVLLGYQNLKQRKQKE
jgi:hypothetical protein